MDLQIDQQQEMLRRTLDRYLEKRLPFDTRRRQGRDDFLPFWRELDAELGVGAAGIGESEGGFGGGPEAEMIVAGSLGRALAVTPYIQSMVLAADLLRRLGRTQELRSLPESDSLAVVAIEEDQTRGDIALIESWADPAEEGWRLNGTKRVVDFAAQADTVLVPARISDGDFALFALTREQLGGTLRPFALIDDTPSADLVFDGFSVPSAALIARGEAVLPALEGAIDRTLAALCAEGVGLAQILVADTLAYAKDRKQFGVPLASFQVLQHRMVDMWSKLQEIEAASLLATLKCDDPSAVSAAKVTVSEGLRHIGQEAVQLHGAMGLTEELRVGHYFKRATVLEHRLGGAARHLDRYRRNRLAPAA